MDENLDDFSDPVTVETFPEWIDREIRAGRATVDRTTQGGMRIIHHPDVPRHSAYLISHPEHIVRIETRHA